MTLDHFLDVSILCFLSPDKKLLTLSLAEEVLDTKKATITAHFCVFDVAPCEAHPSS